MKKKGWDGRVLGEVNAAQKDDLEAFITNLLQGKKVTSRSPVSTAERDLWLTYALRNSTGHDLAGKGAVAKHFFVLFQAVMNTLFTATESLY